MRCVVSDTGPLLHLSEADALSLARLVGDLHVPSQVNAELAYLLSGWEAPTWLTIDMLAASSLWISGRILAEAKSALDEIF